MESIEKKPGQTVFDVVLQHTGAISSLFDFLKLNGLDNIDVADGIFIKPEVINGKVVTFFGAENYYPVTIVANLPIPSGPCANAIWTLKNLSGTVLNNGIIGSGLTSDIIAPNGIILIKNTDLILLQTTPVNSGGTRSVEIENTEIDINGMPWLSLPSGIQHGITLVDQDGIPIVPSLTGNEIKITIPASSSDLDAESFISQTGITDAQQILAINTLVTNLKTTGVWDRLHAIYPFVGGTEDTHKFNLKDSHDDDSSFRLKFNGGWTHSSTGIKPDGSTAYADTFWVPFDNLVNADDFSFGVETKDATDTPSCEIGAVDGSANNYALLNGYAQTYFYMGPSGYFLIYSPALIGYKGFFIFNRNDSLSSKAYIDGAKLTDDVSYTGAASLANIQFFLGARNQYGTPTAYSAKEQQFAFMGKGMNSVEAKAFSASVKLFQTMLGRAI